MVGVLGGRRHELGVTGRVLGLALLLSLSLMRRALVRIDSGIVSVALGRRGPWGRWREGLGGGGLLSVVSHDLEIIGCKRRKRRKELIVDGGL